MRVVRRDHGKGKLLRERENAGIEAALAGGIVRLNLEIVPVLEDVSVPGGRLAGRVVIVAQQMSRDLAYHARRRHDDSIAVPGEQLAIDARLRVEALRVRERG